MGFEKEVLKIVNKAQDDREHQKHWSDTRKMDVMQYCHRQVSKKSSFGVSFNKDAQEVIDKLINKEKDVKRLQKYGKFWKKRNYQIIQNQLRPWLSEDALKTMPYIEEDPQYQTERVNDPSKWLNDTLDEKLRTLMLNRENSKSRISQNWSKTTETSPQRKNLPEVQHAIHPIRNWGEFYVQESLAKSHSPIYKISYKDVQRARDIFTDKKGNINVRAALEGTKEELNKGVVHLMKLQGKKKRIKRNRTFKKLKTKAKAQETHRVLQYVDKTQIHSSRNEHQKSFILPQLNLSIKSPVTKTSKEIAAVPFKADISTIETRPTKNIKIWNEDLPSKDTLEKEERDEERLESSAKIPEIYLPNPRTSLKVPTEKLTQKSMNLLRYLTSLRESHRKGTIDSMTQFSAWSTYGDGVDVESDMTKVNDIIKQLQKCQRESKGQKKVIKQMNQSKAMLDKLRVSDD